MAYVEWLRARGAIKWTVVAMVAILLLAGVCRAMLQHAANLEMREFNALSKAPGSTVVRTTLPDGSTQTVIDNPRKKLRATIVDRGYWGTRVEILDRSGHAGIETFAAGTLAVNTTHVPGGELTVIDTNKPTFVADYAIVAFVFTIIVATILGSPLARESDGHLEIAATQPASRERLALVTMGVDAAAIVVSFALGVLFAVAFHAIFQAPHVEFGTADAYAVAVAILGCIAWYAMLAAATSWMRRGYGMVLGLAWPVAIAVLLLSVVPPTNALFQTIHAISSTLCYVLPFTYMDVTAALAGTSFAGYTPAFQLAMLALLVIVYGATAIVTWRRVEA